MIKCAWLLKKDLLFVVSSLKKKAHLWPTRAKKENKTDNKRNGRRDELN